MLLAFVLIQLIFLFFLATSQNQVNSANSNLKQVILQRKALTVADSLVKNPSNTSTLGLAHYNPSRHRVESNKITLTDFQFLNQKANSINEIRKIFIKLKNNSTITLKSLPLTENCISVQRFVLLDFGLSKEKALLGVVYCE